MWTLPWETQAKVYSTQIGHQQQSHYVQLGRTNEVMGTHGAWVTPEHATLKSLIPSPRRTFPYAAGARLHSAGRELQEGRLRSQHLMTLLPPPHMRKHQQGLWSLLRVVLTLL